MRRVCCEILRLRQTTVKASDLYQLPDSLARFSAFFSPEALPWEWLRQIGPALASLGDAQPLKGSSSALQIEGPVFVHPSVKLPPYGALIGPIWIGAETKLLPGIFLRGNVIVGARCTVGHNAEIKNSLLMDGVQVPHKPYIGDSILGNGAHLGAGVVLSNLRLDQKNIVLRLPEGGAVDTGLRKFGALLGDNAEVGCNSVLNPGTILGRRSLVAPAISFGGVAPGATVVGGSFKPSFSPRKD